MNQKLVAALAASSLLLFLGCPGPGPNNDGGTGGGTATGGGVATGGGQGTGGGVATGGGQGTGGGVATGGGQGTGGGTGEINPDAGPGSGTLTGDLAFSVAKTRAFFFPNIDGGLDMSLVQVALTDVDLANFCSISSAPQVPLQGMRIAVGVADGGAVVPGTYPITAASAFGQTGGTNVARFEFDNGMPTMLTVSATGTVTLNSISSIAVTGNFNAVLELPGDAGFSTLSGTFDSPGCAVGP